MTEIVPVRIIDPADRVRRLVSAFVETLESDDTTKAYRNDLARWVNWCEDQAEPIDPLNARHAHVKAWMAHLRKCSGEADSTRARRLATLSSWYEWLLREETVERNPAKLKTEERPKARRPVSPTSHLAPDQIDALVAAADLDPNPRTAALVAVLVYTGARVGEVMAADIEDLTYEEHDRVLPITGKGRRERTLPLESPVTERLDRYLAARQSAPPTRLPTAPGPTQRRPLFLNDRGKRMGRQSARYIMRRVAKQAGLPAEIADAIHPHVTRHSYATTLLANGVPVRDVQYAMGHADPRTTEWYDHGKPEDHPSRKLAEILSRPKEPQL